MNKGKTDVWLTPPEIIQSLGEFDLDPCSPINRPWDTAKHYYTEEDNGLLLPWFGRVYCNPPYSYSEPWMQKMALHNNGIALLFTRTDTGTFQNHIFPHADSMLFISGRVKFYDQAGQRTKFGQSKEPSVLISYGEHNIQALEECGIKGKHVLINRIPMIIVGRSPSWKNVVKISLIRLGKQASLKQIYDAVEIIAPDKIEKNEHYKAKVRQTLQNYFTRASKGVYTYN